MKRIIVYGTAAGSDALQSLLKERALPFSVVSTHQGSTTVTIYVLDDMLEDLLSKIKDLPGMNETESIIEVASPNFVISPLLEDLKTVKARPEQSKEMPTIEQLVESAEPHTVLDVNKVVLAAIAGVVALIGLLMNNVGIIIGAMLISPLLGPIYAFAVNTAVGNSKNVLNCVKILVALLLMIISISFVTTLFLSFITLITVTAEITSRLNANPVFVVMAILLGFATILALSKGIPEGVAGVAVAAALLPPAVAFGIALVLVPGQAISALTLTLQNVIGLIIGAVVGVVLLHVRPRGSYDQWVAKKFIKRVVWILAILIILIIILSFLV